MNPSDEVLLICMDDPNIHAVGEEYSGPFWTLVGGGIEPGESLLHAAAREVFEETGLGEDDIELGPVVWTSTLNSCCIAARRKSSSNTPLLARGRPM